MKIASIHLQNFKRFTDLKIQNIPATAKLVVLLGPNGCGKSSVFDALNWRRGRSGGSGNFDYYSKFPTQSVGSNQINIEFHNPEQSDMRKAVYVRTAYRNDPEINIESIQKMPPMIQEARVNTMIQNDATATNNFQRLLLNAVESVFNRANRSKTLGEFQDEILRNIQDAMRRLFPGLVLNSLGNPFNGRSFTFDKGTSSNFLYQNLSGGEKAAFDLLLDIFVKRTEYDDTVFCIDTPETHMNPRLQGALLEELFRLMNDKSQLWIATHAIGMMRKALQLYEEHKEEIVFLDFSEKDDRDFDSQAIIEPRTPDRRFWEQTHEIALDDLAALIVPDQIVICEGKHGNKGFDAECYNQIFSEEFPDTKFIAGGGKRELRNYIPVIEAVATGVTVFGLRDRDQATCGEINQWKQEGIKVLEQRQIEDYLLANDVLCTLCQHYKLEPCEEKADELMELRDGISNIKEASEEIRRKVIEWGMHGVGETRDGFLRDTIAPLIKPRMPTYDELKRIIFGS